MSTHNMGFYEEISKISLNYPQICTLSLLLIMRHKDLRSHCIYCDKYNSQFFYQNIYWWKKFILHSLIFLSLSIHKPITMSYVCIHRCVNYVSPRRVGRHIVFPRASGCPSVCPSVCHESCPLCNLKTPEAIFTKLHTNINQH